MDDNKKGASSAFFMMLIKVCHQTHYAEVQNI